MLGLARKKKVDELETLVEALNEAVSDSTAFRIEFDQPYAHTNMEQLSGHSYALREWSAIERDNVLERAHQAWERNPIAAAAVKFTTQFTVGKGMRIVYRNHRVKEVIDRYIENPDNDFQFMEKETMDFLQVDGEIFLRFITTPTDDIVTTAIPAWAVRDILVHPLIRRKKMVYKIARSWVAPKDDDNTWDMLKNDEVVEIQAEEILHIAINKAPYEVRGRSDLFRILPWLKAYKDWLENRARINRLKSAILFHVSLAGASQATINSKRNTYKKPPDPGSLVVSSDKEEWEILGSKIEAGDAAEDGRQIKLMAAAGKQMPEYFFGDGTNANLATARAQQLPVLKAFADYQDIGANQIWKPVFKRVIRAAIESGVLPEKVQEEDGEGNPVMMPDPMKPGEPPPARDPETGVRKEPVKGKIRMIKSVDAFEILYPELESDDPKNLAQALEIAQGANWVSPETASSRMGFDYQEEQRRIAIAKASAEMRGDKPDDIFGKGKERDRGDEEPRSGKKTGPGASVGNR